MILRAKNIASNIMAPRITFSGLFWSFSGSVFLFTDDIGTSVYYTKYYTDSAENALD